MEGEAAEILASIAGGHHGSFPGPSYYPGKSADKWIEASTEAAKVLGIILRKGGWEKHETISFEFNANDVGSLLLFAGIATVSDWIASNEAIFPLVVVEDKALPIFIEERQRIAHEAVAHLHLSAPSPKFQAMTEADLATLLGLKGKPLNELQRAVARAANAANGPCLILIEAPMGWGKTEAAELGYYAVAEREAAGLYYGLPTQATGSMMYRRVNRYLARAYGENLIESHLLHGEAFLDEEYNSLKVSIGSVNDADTGLVATDWFCSPKRGLLATSGIGTIDQALLGVLKRRHFFVRLFGLAGKVVILDEIHAYDQYMSEVILRLIEWLAELDCTVILLSATLSAGWRDRLMRAYDHSCTMPTPTYPCVVKVERGKSPFAPSIVRSPAQEKTAHLVLHRIPECEWIDNMARTAIVESRDRCIACVCNTVGHAQELYSRIRNIDPKIELHILHARFTRKDRSVKEETVVSRFGRGGIRPRRAIVVATQIIEQSLDLDFDLLITELAPIDLVLQRLGRVMRHTRGRPEENSPRAIIFAPPSLSKDCFGLSGLIYEPIILGRSLALMASDRGKNIDIPSGIPEVIEAVYGERPIICDASLEALFDTWQTTADGKGAGDRFSARNAEIPNPDTISKDWSCIETIATETDDESIISTRLGLPSLSVAILDAAPTINPDAIEIRAAIDNTVKISSPRLYKHLKKGLEISVWKECGPLHRTLPLVFDGLTWFDNEWTLTYDRDTGLSYKEGGKIDDL